MFRVVVDPSSFEVIASGTVVGKLHLVLDDECFPEEGWWDFPPVVLDWWIQAIRSAGEDEFELLFMDGPFRVKCSPSGDRVRLALTEVGATRNYEVASGFSTIGEMTTEIEAAALMTATHCLKSSLPTGGLDVALGLGS